MFTQFAIHNQILKYFIEFYRLDLGVTLLEILFQNLNIHKKYFSFDQIHVKLKVGPNVVNLIGSNPVYPINVKRDT